MRVNTLFVIEAIFDVLSNASAAVALVASGVLLYVGWSTGDATPVAYLVLGLLAVTFGSIVISMTAAMMNPDWQPRPKTKWKKEIRA